MGLFKPAWQGDNKDKALKAVDKETDQTTLAEIAKTAPLADARMEAVKKITDQKIITDLAKNTNNDIVRTAAIKKLTDQHILADIAKNDGDYQIRIAAVKTLSDKTLLTDIVMTNKDGWVLPYALAKLYDQKTLNNIAVNDDFKWARKTVAAKLTDQELLVNIALNDTDEWARESAINNKNMKDQSILAEIAKNDSNHVVYGAACKKLSNQAAIIDVVKNAHNLPYDTRCELVEKLMDVSTLTDIAENDKDERVRCCAIAQLCKGEKASGDKINSLIAGLIGYMESIELIWAKNACYIVNTLKSINCSQYGVRIDLRYSDGWSNYTMYYNEKLIGRW
jgi:hypothetical protein